MDFAELYTDEDYIFFFIPEQKKLAYFTLQYALTPFDILFKFGSTIAYNFLPIK